MNETRRRRRGNAVFWAGALLIAAFVAIAVIGPMVFSSSANGIDPLNARKSPSLSNSFGTDGFGRDILARVITATRLTLLLTFGASIISFAAGTFIGVVVRLLGPRLQGAILQVNAVAVAFPALILALVVAAILGPGSTSAMVAVGIAGIPMYIRLTSTLAAQVVNEDFVRIAELQRVPRVVVAIRHVLPNVAIPLSVAAANSTAFTLVELSSLSFLGLGVQAPEYDYGRLLNEGLAEMSSQPWGVFGPSIGMVALGLGILLFGDGLAAMVDPKMSAPQGAITRFIEKVKSGTRTSTRSTAEPEPAVAVENLSIGTISEAGDRHTLVNGVSLHIAPQEILGIVGESGSGKSLTAMSIAGLAPNGLWRTASGMRIRETDMLNRPAPSVLARTVSLIYQDPMSTFSPSLRLESQLGDVFREHMGWDRDRIHRELLEALTSLSTPNPERVLSQFPHQLSGGLLQRCLIAQALLLDPELLIADEPTTALDVSVQADVLRKIYRFRAESGASILLISHDLGVVEELCDRVLVMYRGEFVEELTPAQIRTRNVQHPYTQRLLDATLYLEAAREGGDR
ncbi:dipeptide/oligopeptide/nickel ABC transporter permease/ATP-binding protein [Brevibacterium yomogidense]|uniref:Oligopeptide transport ATP-binding protein OppD (TC 3.A.1.5.1) n=1 Tax=Brevibacterium yomogidense TaxID=946573 RepID=A0A1X6XLF2_9MICO|nr:dipeptide/oligopeptide/nickel ABC transporter permease/ATP-binding protein [Brevibacterium yomogidense]SLM99986.1 Oligopeptide transport ATP-binding protein OppD (TC 3.A.1.5.1) [Brevibacterium yomogidense]